MVHTMQVRGETADEMMFGCPVCGRLIVVGKHMPKLVVIETGSQVPHVGGTTGRLSLVIMEPLEIGQD